MGLNELYASFLESPGTKAYSPKEALALFEGCEAIQPRIELTHADLLESNAGQRHRGSVLKFAKAIWPRSIIKKFLGTFGLFLLIEGRKPKR